MVFPPSIQIGEFFLTKTCGLEITSLPVFASENLGMLFMLQYPKDWKVFQEFLENLKNRLPRFLKEFSMNLKAFRMFLVRLEWILLDFMEDMNYISDNQTR